MQWRFMTQAPTLDGRDATFKSSGEADSSVIESGRAVVCDFHAEDGEFDVAVFVDEPPPAEFEGKTVQRAQGVLHLPSGRLIFTPADRDQVTIAPGSYAVEVAWLHWPLEEHRHKVRAIVGDAEMDKLDALVAQRNAEDRKAEGRGRLGCLVTAGLFFTGFACVAVAAVLPAGRVYESLGAIAVGCVGAAILGVVGFLVWQVNGWRMSPTQDALLSQAVKLGRASAALDEPWLVLTLRRFAEGEIPPDAKGILSRREWSKPG
jgi:hypothetical protein